MTARELSVGAVPCLRARDLRRGAGLGALLPGRVRVGLWDALWAAGRGRGMRACGYRAIDALRVEKGYRVWGTDITPEETPVEAGLGLRREAGQGRVHRPRAALAATGGGRPVRLYCLALADRSVCLGPEPVRIGGEIVGRVTSGGYGFAVERLDRVCLPARRRSRGAARGSRSRCSASGSAPRSPRSRCGIPPARRIRA